jgi:flavin reductase (DIM6/NTAB) family NADH-FMN oxidoreductase RutF
MHREPHAVLPKQDGESMKISIGAKPLLYTHPVVVIGSFDREDRPNVMTASWAGICCSSPPAVAVSIQKTRKTYENILDKRAFTISIPSRAHVEAVDFWGIASGKETDKFTATGLTPERSTIVDAPYVKEFPVVLECRLIHTTDIGVHTQFIGEILDVKVDGNVMDAGGRPDINRISPFVYDSIGRRYLDIGPTLATAFSAGRTYCSDRGAGRISR